MSLSGSTIVLMFLSSLLCLPPYLAYLLFHRSRRRARRHGFDTRRYTAAMAVSYAAFLYNLLAFVLTVRRMAGGDFTPGTMEVVAIAFAWVSFWVWLFLTAVLGRRLGHSRKPL